MPLPPVWGLLYICVILAGAESTGRRGGRKGGSDGYVSLWPKEYVLAAKYPCTDGNHGCDSKDGNLCISKHKGHWACTCQPGFKCTSSCTNNKVAHTCVKGGVRWRGTSPPKSGELGGKYLASARKEQERCPGESLRCPNRKDSEVRPEALLNKWATMWKIAGDNKLLGPTGCLVRALDS